MSPGLLFGTLVSLAVAEANIGPPRGRRGAKASPPPVTRHRLAPGPQHSLAGNLHQPTDYGERYSKCVR